MAVSQGTQGALPGLAPRARRASKPKAPKPLAADLPIARVCVEVPAAHLDRLYDYSVPEELAELAQPGVRVSVMYGGRRVTGYVVERVAKPEHAGKLSPLNRVPSGLVVVPPALWRLVDSVAERYAGTRSDVLRLAVPPAHVATEKKLLGQAQQNLTYKETCPQPASAWEVAAWQPYRGGAAFLDQLTAGRPVKAAWAALPWVTLSNGGVNADATESSTPVDRTDGSSEPVMLGEPVGQDQSDRSPAAEHGWKGQSGQSAAEGEPDGSGKESDLAGLKQPNGELMPGLNAGMVAAIRATLRSGRQTLVVCPNEREVDRLMAGLANAGIGQCVRLVASDGAAARVRAYTALRLGQAAVGVGTRAAAFQPLAKPGLLALIDDGDSALAEPHAPYPPARQVLALRAAQESCSLLLAGISRSVETQALVQAGWLVDLSAPRTAVRAATARVMVPDQAQLDAEGGLGTARLPGVASRLLRQGLEQGRPVLIQVPRAGYVPALACATCRELARCPTCHGAMRFDAAGQTAHCGRCGQADGGFLCPECGGRHLRSIAVGASRTAEELGRAFPGVKLIYSAADAPGGVVDQVANQPALIVATPGAEPVVPGGYAAAALLDGGVLTGRPELSAGAQALRHWLRAASLVCPASLGGRVLLLGWPAAVPSGALVRWDPVGFAERELAERVELGLPPARKSVVLSGAESVLAELLGGLDLGPEVQVLGPIKQDPARLILLVPHGLSKNLVNQVRLRANQLVLGKRGSLRIQVDGSID